MQTLKKELWAVIFSLICFAAMSLLSTNMANDKPAVDANSLLITGEVDLLLKVCGFLLKCGRVVCRTAPFGVYSGALARGGAV